MNTTQTIQKIMAVLLAAFILGAAFVTEAQAQDQIGIIGGGIDQSDRIGWGDQDGRDRHDRRDRDRRRERDERDHRDRRPRLEEREARLNRFYSRQSIDLEQLFQLRYEAPGTEIVSVNVIVARSDRSLISLTVDNRIEASQIVYEGSNLLNPRRQLEIGRDFRFLYLDIPGSVHIESIRLTLANGEEHSNPGRVLEEVVNQRLSHGQVLDLAYVMRLYPYREFSISDIEIEGRTVGHYVGSVAFLVNNFPESQAALVPGQSTHLFLRQPVAIYGKSLLLQAQGDLIIDRIRLRLERR